MTTTRIPFILATVIPMWVAPATGQQASTQSPDHKLFAPRGLHEAAAGGGACGAITSSIPPDGAVDARQPHALDDDGVPEGWQIIKVRFSSDLTQSYAATLNLPIPDDDFDGLAHNFILQDRVLIIDLDVGLNIAHANVGDLVVTLSHAGETVVLVDRPGVPGTEFGSQRNGLDVILDDDGEGGPINDIPVDEGPAVTSPPAYVPEESLDVFNSMYVDGQWRLRVADIEPRDEGILVGWSLLFTIAIPVDAPHPDDFVITQDGVDGDPPIVEDIVQTGKVRYELMLDRPLTPRAETTIAHPCSGSTIRLGYLPMDVDGDCTAAVGDLLVLIDHLNGVIDPPLNGWQCDLDRSGTCDPLDILRGVDLLNGANAFEPWANEVLPCECVDCPLEFTLGQDDLSGSKRDDHFDAPLEFVDKEGLQFPTLQTGDVASGLDGYDRLTASFVGGESPAPQLLGIEQIEMSNFGPTPGEVGTSTESLTVLQGQNISGTESIFSVNSTDDVLVADLPGPVDFGMSNVQNPAVDLAVGFAGGTAGATDRVKFFVGSTVGGAIMVLPPGEDNGIEILDIVSGGAAANTITTVLHVQDDDTPETYLDNPPATSLTQCVLEGPAPLTTRRFPDSVVEFNAAQLNGGWTLGSGDGSAADPFVPFHETDQDIVEIWGGPGDDLFIFGEQFNQMDASHPSEFIVGNGGLDTLQATLIADFAVVAPLLDIQHLILDARGGNRSINLTGVTGIEAVFLTGATGDAQAETLTLLNISGSPLPVLGFVGDGAQAKQGYDGVTYTATGVAGSGDSLAVSLNNRGTPLNQAGTTNVHAPGLITANNIEIFSLDVQDGPALFSNVTSSTMTSFAVSAVSNVSLGTVGTGGVGNTITSLNFAAVIGNLTGTFVGCTNGVSITGAAGNDHITVANSTSMTSSVINTQNGDDTFVSQDTDSADVISTGSGHDMITPLGGNDVITPGDGNDVILFGSTIGSAPVNADGADQISGWAVGDVLRFGAAPPPLATGTVGADNMTVIGDNGTHTTVIVDLDTTAGTSYLTITLTGVTLTSANFAIQNTTDIVRTN